MLLNILIPNLLSFSIILLTSLVLFATGLLYLDAWQVSRRRQTPLLRSLGFFLLSFTIFSNLFPVITTYSIILGSVKLIALATIAISLFVEPIIPTPQNKKSPALFSLLSLPATIIFTSLISIAYFIKGKKGLEKQLLPAGLAFLFYTLAELTEYFLTFSSTNNIALAKLLASFGYVWYLKLLFLLVGSIILGSWAWGYIRFRLQLQVFLATLSATLLIFVATTATYTYFLTQNIEAETLKSLETNGKVFQYSLERLQFEALSNSRAAATDSQLQESVIKGNESKLSSLANFFLLAQNSNLLNITDNEGLVLARAENLEKTGDNISNNLLVKSALNGQALAGIFVDTGAISPEIKVGAAFPIESAEDNNILGSVLSAFNIDNAFLDGVKSITDLDVAIYAGDTRVATTLLAPDGISRYSGSKESNPQVLNKVLNQKTTYLGTSNILNQPYYSTYLPLRNYQGEVIGMLFAGQPQLKLVETVQKAVNSTFVGSGILILISILPIYLLSKYLKENIEA